METDLVIIGAGVAGLTAAITAAGHGIETVVIERLAAGGQISTVENIRNFPSHPEGIAGFELGPLLQEQAEAHGAGFLFGEVLSIEQEGQRFRIQLAGEDVLAKALILAAGSTRKTLGVPGEARLEGRGISHCAACDGHFFQGKTVIVAGGGDSAFDEADLLATLAEKIIILHRGDVPVARREAQEKIAAHANVEVLPDAEIAAVNGEDRVQSVDVIASGQNRSIGCDGVFVYVGLAPNTALVDHLVKLDPDGRVIADAMLRTPVPGLFVAGDLRGGTASLLSSSAGDGATAAIAASRFLSGIEAVQ